MTNRETESKTQGGTEHAEPMPVLGPQPSQSAQSEAALGESDKAHNYLNQPGPVSVNDVLPEDSLTDDKSAPLDLGVTIPAGLAVLGVVLWGLLGQDSFSSFAGTSLTWVVDNVGWLFILSGTVFVLFVVGIAISKFGHIRLGKDAEKPEFSTPSWIAMMFAAGMGIGLMFYGVAEPLTFYRDGVPGHEAKEVGTAFATTMFHWTLHPWALYAIVGLAIAYSSYRLGRKQLISAAFIPLIGAKHAEGWPGKIIDALAIFATVFGTAASLGIGIMQISAGLEINGVVSGQSLGLWVALIVGLSICFLLSALSGVGRGIQFVSNFNMVAAGVLALLVLVLGPTVVILNLIPTSIGSYLGQFFSMAARSAASADGTAGKWLSGWTIFYWAWWVSWSPFVGMFIARISRGRTIREFIFTVVIVPSLVSAVWFSIFGGSAIHFEQIGQSIWGDGNSESQLFNLLHNLPMGTVTSAIAMVLLATFFITSADSAATVMGTMSQSGRITASRPITAMWGIATALIAVVLLASGGDDALSNLQNLTILAASPFLLVILALMFSLVKGLSEDPMYLDDREQRRFALKMARERRLAAVAAERERRRIRSVRGH